MILEYSPSESSMDSTKISPSTCEYLQRQSKYSKLELIYSSTISHHTPDRIYSLNQSKTNNSIHNCTMKLKPTALFTLLLAATAFSSPTPTPKKGAAMSIEDPLTCQRVYGHAAEELKKKIGEKKEDYFVKSKATPTVWYEKCRYDMFRRADLRKAEEQKRHREWLEKSYEKLPEKGHHA